MQIGAAYQVDQFPGADFGAKLQACLSCVECELRRDVRCAEFYRQPGDGLERDDVDCQRDCVAAVRDDRDGESIVVTAGTRNVALRGCALRGGKRGEREPGRNGVCVFGRGRDVQVGDPTYAVDTPGFHLDNVVINTTGADERDGTGIGGVSHAGDGS